MTLWLVVKTQVHRVGWSQGFWFGVEYGVETDLGGGQVLGDEGIADGIAVHLAFGVEDVECGGVSGDRMFREACVHKGVAIHPLAAVRIDVRL